MLHVHSIGCLYTSLGFQQITHRSKQMTDVFQHMFSEENYQNASTHFSLPQASTSVWNNCRDQEVEFDWQHMFQQS